MTNAIIPRESLGLETKKNADLIDRFAKGGFLWGICILYGGSHDAVKDELIGINRYGLRHAKDDIEDLGKELNMVPVAYRTKAVEFSSALSIYDPEDPEFERIVDAADSGGKGFGYGVELLLWVDKLDQFVVYFFGSKSSRRIGAKIINESMGLGLTMSMKTIENTFGKWPIPVIKPCSTPLSGPDIDRLKAALEKFNNPPKNEVETVEPTGRAT